MVRMTMVTAIVGGALWAAHATLQALRLRFDEPALPPLHPGAPWHATTGGGRFVLHLRGTETLSGKVFVSAAEGAIAGTIRGYRRGDEVSLVLVFSPERTLALEGEFSFDGRRLTLLDASGKQIRFVQA